MLINGHEIMVPGDCLQMSTACSGRLLRWIHFEGQGPAWLRPSVQETNMPFIRMEEKMYYEFRLVCILLRL